MRLFKDREKAEKSCENKDVYWMNSICPFNGGDLMCGSWCALFYYEKREDGVSYIMLGCKSTDKQLFIDGIVE